ncbi:FG-GAP-like repeat-containing protein [Dyadobacter sp. CY312]|uniref:FG-GAP-like repeat-containing protein n=1 Tax=Dyadobacter sp. CY312 TaxID=2907303 RepID=UPI001F160D35|nr:FG-GAP-like repeat-containing protein [Dyadobacter sp. CY312]MCE7043819.1 FG-GAP-like repeat-containing protein [Dyadobacter sp. CY312]
MRTLYLLAFFIVSSFRLVGQNVVYTSLYDNASFNGRALVQTLPVGSTPGAGNVSGSGGASYSIPIGVPPGTNGISPSVSLEYNSQAGSGIAGMGWNLSGMSVISRVGKNVYFDGAAGAVELSANDRFALDGSRLILKSGTYGAAGSTYGPESEDFSTITAVGVSGNGPTSFQVLTKDGVKMEFGNTADSRFMSQTGGHVMFWRLNKLRYPDGNYIEFVYSTTTTERDSRLLQVKYTGNDTPGSILAPYNVIEFSYKVRQEASPGTFSDIRTSYESGSSVLSKYLLDSIAVKAEGIIAKSYRLAYGHDNVNSYLKSVTERGSDNTALNPTIFKYGDKPTEVTSSSTTIAGTNIQTISGDFDGDGKRDILSANQSHTDQDIPFFNQFTIHKANVGGGYTTIATQSLPVTSTIIQKQEIPNSKSFLASDYTGDGIDDVLMLNISNQGSYLKLDNVTIYESQNGGTSFIARQRSIQPNFNRIPSNKQFFYPGDFDGDGISEYVSILGNSTGLYGAFICGNYLTTGACGEINPSGTVSLPPNMWHTATRITPLDFNGDGKTDLMVENIGSYEVFTIQGYNAVRLASGLLPNRDLSFIGDFNGDGKTDIIYANTNFSTLYKEISSGTGFIQTPFELAQRWFSNSPSQVGGQTDRFIVGDYNGDGKSDIYHYWMRQVVYENPIGGNNLHTFLVTDIYYSQGDTFKSKELFFSETINAYGRPSTITYQADVPMDLDGDGRTDLVTSGGTNVHVQFFNKNGTDNLLQKVSNGFNHVTEWNYKSLVEGGTFYTKGSATSSFPLNVIQPAAILASDMKVPNGIGGLSTAQYSYEGLRLHRSGKGSLGFGKVTVSNLTSGTKTVSENEFNTTYYTSAPKKTATYLTAGNVLLTETTIVNEFIAQGPAADKRFLYRLKSSSENNVFEGRTASSVNNTFDSYGNVTKSTQTNGVETVVTDALYGAYPSGTPNKPTTVTTTKTRSGQTAFAATQVMGYNGLGQLTSKTDFDGLAKKVVTGYEYFPWGNLKKTTVTPYGDNAPAVSSSSVVYDTKGRYPESSTNQLSQVSSATYDAKWGKALTGTGIDGLTTSYQYDGFGRTKIITPPATTAYNITETYGWDINTAEGTVWYSLVSQPGKPYVKTWYDLLGRERKTETKGFDDQLVTQTQAYDARGNVSVSTQPHKAAEPFVTTTTSYDTYNRRSVTNGGALGSTTTTYAYSAGNLTVTTAAPNGTSSKTTDASGKVIAATDNGGTLNYTYYSHGGLRDVKNGSTTLTSNEYDAYGRQTKLTDGNAGVTQYVYNAVGQLISQTNASGQTHTMAYNIMGQVTSRVGPEGTTSYSYGTTNTGGESKNRIKQVTGFTPGNQTNYIYDAFGRVATLVEKVDATDHVTSYTYNNLNEILTTTYPSGLVITNAYKVNGYLEKIKNGSTDLYTVTAMNGQDQVTSHLKGTKSSTTTYSWGFPTSYVTTGIQSYELAWDYQKGNLTSRKDARSTVNKTETFLYDNLNRLTSATVSGSAAFTATYASNGNVNTKTDAGTYSYDATKFNAVTGVTNPAPVPVPLMQQDISYTAFMQPNVITENNYELTYTYGADYERIKSVTKQGGSVINTRFYFADGFEKDITAGTTRYIQYIASPAGLAAIVESIGTTHTVHYTYTDHLGSILTVTNSAGTTIEGEQSFDAWGRRRNVTSWALLAPTASTGLPVWLYRGYTGHEHLDRFGLTNMNGRMYDPVLGRMLSPDNYVQESGMTQSFNRYTYAMNNPLVYTDPDGNFWNFVIGAAIGGFSGWQIGKAKGASGWGMFGYIVGGAAIGAATAGIGEAVTGAFGAAASGATSASIGAYATAGAATGAFGGAAFSALGGGSWGEVGKAALMGGLLGGAGGAFSGYLKYANYESAMQRSLERQISNKDYWLAQIGDPGDKPIFAGTLGAVTITRPWWHGLGFTLARGVASVLTLPFILEGDVSKKRPNNYTTMYRNMSSEEYSSFMRKGKNFGFGKGMFDSKQFWMTPDGLQNWNGSGMTTGPYNVAISVPTKVIGPNGLVQLRQLDGHLAGTVRASNLNTFNRVKIVIHVFGN